MKNYINDKSEIFSYEDDTPKEILELKIKELGLTPISDEDLTILRTPSDEEMLRKQQKAFNDAIQIHLDTQAQSLRYDNINAIGKYVGYENDFQAEAEALGAWASSCWKVAGEIEADVKAGNRDMPTVDEVLAELPVFE